MSTTSSGTPREPFFLEHLTANVWQQPQGHLHRNRLVREAGELAASHLLPISLEEWKGREAALREHLRQKLHLGGELPPLEVEEHGEIRCEGYVIRKYSFLGTRQNRIPVNVYIPDGEGPFPAMLNVHGHHLDGKIATRVQERGHILALNGIVTLCVDAAGAGERGENEREWVYHGAALAAEMFLYGDTLLALQVRDNMRCVDFLQSLPYVKAERIGVTGASGGGNQTMWLAALDERIQVAVPVVSIGSFEAYITRCNCVCETLPGFLQEAEEWALLGLIAPRALLVINALHDMPSFGYEPMSATTRSAQEIYRLYGMRHACDFRILNSTHGYFPEAQEAMLGWVKHWLLDAPRTTPETLPFYTTLPSEELICFPKGERPETLDYRKFRRERLAIAAQSATGDREGLSKLLGWSPVAPAVLSTTRETGAGVQVGHFVSPRSIPIPLKSSGKLKGELSSLRVILSSGGKSGAFAREAASRATEETLVLIDLPATGELSWEPEAVARGRFHDSTRAAIWMGYTLAQEWAEVVAALLATLRAQAPEAKITVEAEADAAFAVLIAQALQPVSNVAIQEHSMPTDLLEDASVKLSLVWHIPGFFGWGDLNALRALACTA